MSVLAPKETKTVGQSVASIKPTAPVHILVQEKINLFADRNGGVDQFEVNNCLISLVVLFISHL